VNFSQRMKDFVGANYTFFDELGSPGGASKVGKVEKDAAFVAGLPPQEAKH